MQLSRHLLMTCAVATFLTPTLVHAYDNEAQIRARQALEEKMNTIGAQTPAGTSAPPAVVAKPAANSVVTTTRPSAAQSDAVRQALEQKMKEMQAQTPPTPPAPPAPPVKPKSAPRHVVAAPKPEAPTVTIAPAMPATPASAPEISQPATPAAVTSPVVAAPTMAMPTTDNVSSDKLSQALHQKMTETASEPAVMPPVKPAPPVAMKAPPVQWNNTVTKPTAPPAPATPPVAVSAPTYAPIPETSNVARPELPMTPTPEPVAGQNQVTPFVNLPALSGPPSSLSAAKQQKLDALLQQYRMDQLTPQQYHEQRAKVLAEP
jgi:hypothetical protein